MSVCASHLRVKHTHTHTHTHTHASTVVVCRQIFVPLYCLFFFLFFSFFFHLVSILRARAPSLASKPTAICLFLSRFVSHTLRLSPAHARAQNHAQTETHFVVGRCLWEGSDMSFDHCESGGGSEPRSLVFGTVCDSLSLLLTSPPH